MAGTAGVRAGSPRHGLRPGWLRAAGLALLVGACSSDDGESSAPDVAIEAETEFGTRFDDAALDTIAAAAEQAKSTCFLVGADGEVHLDRTFGDGKPQEVDVTLDSDDGATARTQD